MGYNSKYTGAEVEALLDAANGKQDAIEDLDAIRAGAAAGATALQSVPPEYVTETELTNKGYATTAALNDKVDKVSGKGLSTNDFTTALKNKLEGLSNYDDTAINSAVTTLRSDFDKLVSGDSTTAIKTFNEIIAFLDGIADSESLDSIISSIEQQIAGKQATISDLATIRSGAALGASAVQPSNLAKVATSGSYNDLSDKPAIPSAVTESTVSGWGFTKNTGTYSKPSGGIPKTDLASAVQTSLGKADTALQSHQQLKTINGQSIVGSGNITIESSNNQSGTYVTIFTIEELWEGINYAQENAESYFPLNADGQGLWDALSSNQAILIPRADYAGYAQAISTQSDRDGYTCLTIVDNNITIYINCNSNELFQGNTIVLHNNDITIESTDTEISPNTIVKRDSDGAISASGIWDDSGTLWATESSPEEIQANADYIFQSKIEDIDEIRAGAALGKTALQSETYKGTITGVSANGTSVATSGVANIPAASTSAYGVTKLSSATNSTSTTLAATASAVKSAYDLANSYKGTVTGVKVNGSTKSPSSGTVDIGNVVTSVKVNGSTYSPSSGVVDLGTISGGGGSSSAEAFIMNGITYDEIIETFNSGANSKYGQDEHDSAGIRIAFSSKVPVYIRKSYSENEPSLIPVTGT